MDNKVFKIITDGTCAYFLIMYSCLIFLIELWYSPIGDGLLGRVGLCLLMLLIGFFLFYQYKKVLANNPENESSAMSSSSVELLGGAVTLIIILQLLIRQLIMTIVQFSPQTNWGFLLFLLIYVPFIVIAVIKIKKGLKIKEHKKFSGSINFLCYRVILLYLLFTGVYQLMISFEGVFMTQDYTFTSFDFYWNLVPIGSVAAALILYFVPSHRKRTIKNAENPSCNDLISQSYIMGGYLLFVTSLFSSIDLLVSSLTRMSFEFEFFQALIFLILSIVIIFYGKKRYYR